MASAWYGDRDVFGLEIMLFIKEAEMYVHSISKKVSIDEMFFCER